jgi:predicted outer membrane protein
MKAILIAAALVVPIAARADDPNKDMGSSKSTTPSTSTINDDSFSEAKVLNKIHHVNKKHVELGQLVQTRGGTDKIRNFGAKLVRDHQKLDKDVISYAKTKNITLDEAFTEMSSALPSTGGSSTSMGSNETGGRNAEAGTGATASGDLNAPGNPGGSSSTNRSGSQMGTATPNSYDQPNRGAAGTTNESPGSTVARSPSTGASGNQDRYGSTGSQGGSGSNYQQPQPGSTDTTARSDSTGTTVGATGTSKADQWAQKLEDLKSLQGSEFDSRFLSTVVDNADQAISRLQGFKGQGDKKLDRLIDQSVKLLQNHRDDAQKLQQRTPAA